jgi:hypothetical protein
MERIFPIDGPTVTPFVGKSVCAVLHDGTHFFGTLEGIDGDRLIINGFAGGPGELETLAMKKKRPSEKSGQANTSAFFPGFGFNRFFFPFAALAFLFALPFLFGFPFFI